VTVGVGVMVGVGVAVGVCVGVGVSVGGAGVLDGGISVGNKGTPSTELHAESDMVKRRKESQRVRLMLTLHATQRRIVIPLHKQGPGLVPGSLMTFPEAGLFQPGGASP